MVTFSCSDTGVPLSTRWLVLRKGRSGCLWEAAGKLSGLACLGIIPLFGLLKEELWEGPMSAFESTFQEDKIKVVRGGKNFKSPAVLVFRGTCWYPQPSSSSGIAGALAVRLSHKDENPGFLNINIPFWVFAGGTWGIVFWGNSFIFFLITLPNACKTAALVENKGTYYLCSLEIVAIECASEGRSMLRNNTVGCIGKIFWKVTKLW